MNAKRALIPCQLLVVLLVMTGCASIPREAPELSAELGNRISALEQSHLTLVHRFFDQKRRDIDDFIMEEWVPTFARNFFDNADIAEAWNIIVSENDKAERLKFIQVLGPRIQEKINAKRMELVSPIDRLERRVETRIRQDYDLARSLNNSITSFLVSASKVEENRNRYLEMIGVTEDAVGNVIDEVDQAVTSLLSKARTAENAAGLVTDYMNKIENLTKNL